MSLRPSKEHANPDNVSVARTLATPLQRLESSSSPNLLVGTDITESPVFLESPRTKGASLTRSNTLPKGPHHAAAALAFTELEESKLSRFREWMTCILIVQFDVDYGPKIEYITPAVEISQSERDNMSVCVKALQTRDIYRTDVTSAFSAFPDTAHPNSGTQVHSFRIRSTLSQGPIIKEAENDSILITADGFLYGYCAFTQQRDKTLKRGYLQRSLVFLSQHPFPALFSSILATAITLFLQHGYETLETACHNISNWPSPKAASTLELGFLGSILHVEMPQHVDQQQLTETSSFGETFDSSRHILASHPPIEITAVEIFSAILPSLWSLWECLVLSEPVFLYAPSPALASAAIWWLRDWIRPIPIAGDFRPYFTIHDPDHKRLVNKNTILPGVIIGTTNPFLYEECKHWPHIISLGAGATMKAPRNSPGPPPGFKTTHRRYISKDRVLLKELENALREGVTGKERLRISNLLRHHFASRANGLLVPLNRYLTSLIPTPTSSPAIPVQVPESSRSTAQVRQIDVASGNNLASVPAQRMAPFNQSDMLASLQRYGSPLQWKSTARRKEFYERWLRTNAFSAWLMREEGIVTRVLAERAGSYI